MSFSDRLSTILEGRSLRPAIITMKRGTIIEADHVRVVVRPSKAGDKRMLVAGISPGRFEAEQQSCNPGLIVKKMRDFYGIPRYVIIPKLQNESDGSDKHGVCTTCDRWYLECMEEPCHTPKYEYDLHRAYVTTRLFRKILTINPENVKSIQYL